MEIYTHLPTKRMIDKTIFDGMMLVAIFGLWSIGEWFFPFAKGIAAVASIVYFINQTKILYEGILKPLFIKLRRKKKPKPQNDEEFI